MCRIAAFVGAREATLSSLLFDPPHSLEKVAHSPRELLRGAVNVDGTGVAWWSGEDPEPMSYVSSQPPWSDPNLTGLSRRLSGSTIVAAVRSATPGIPFGTSNVAPFTGEGIAMVHNGWIGGFRDGLGRELLGRLTDDRFADLHSMNDSLALFLLLRQAVDNHPGSELATSLENMIQDVAKVVTSAGESATLNIVAARRGEIAAVRTSVQFAVNSLYMKEAPTGNLIASEALDDSDKWQGVPAGSVLTMTATRLDVTAIEHEGVAR